MFKLSPSQIQQFAEMKCVYFEYSIKSSSAELTGTDSCLCDINCSEDEVTSKCVQEQKRRLEGVIDDNWEWSIKVIKYDDIA